MLNDEEEHNLNFTKVTEDFFSFLVVANTFVARFSTATLSVCFLSAPKVWAQRPRSMPGCVNA
jgi:hypothetical protein